jgi:tetratricopeptide (TPR) repeat protein
VGELWEERLGDNNRAVEAYNEVLTVDPQNLPALKALERLYEKTGNMEAYLDVIEHQLEVTGEDDERVALYQRMAQVWEEQFSKNERAIDNLQKILLIDDRNQRAYRDLERLYRIERNWDALVENYRRHILVATDPGERTELYSAMGHVYEEELHDPDRAIEAFGDVLSFDPDHVDALRGLARLYEQTEQWERAVEVMQRLVGSVDAKDKVDLNYRLGKIFDEQMRVPETAEERLIEALAIEPTHVPSMLALLNLYRRRGDSMKAAQLMVRAEANTPNVLEKTRLLYEAGKIYQTDIGDEDKATELYARTLALDPEHVEAAEPLAELYFRRAQWGPLVSVLEMLARKADRKANKELNVLYYRLAKAADQLGEGDKALRYYKQAYELDSTHLPTLLDRANLLYRREQWDDAFKLYQTILVHHRESQKDSDIVEIFHRIGQIKLKVGERPKAINMFEKALEIHPGHRPTLEALVDIYSAAGDWEAVIRQKRALLAHTADADEKLAVHEQIIQIYKDKIKNPQKAIAAYLEALEIKPNAHHLLHDVLDLFTETKQWKKAVEILMRLAGLEKGKLRAKYLEAAGNITNYELHATDEAVELYNQALDEDPDNLKTFERIDKIMTAKKDWKSQERAYRRMIKRLGNEVPAEKRQMQVALWHALGVIYRDRLKDVRAATQAFEVCVQLEPEGLQRHQILAELYQAQGPEGYEKALKEYRFIIKTAKDPVQVAPQLKTLRKLYMDLNQYDRAWCVTSVLGFLRLADPEEQRFYEQYKPKGSVRAKARLNEELWQKKVYHPDEDRHISQVFAAISQSVAAGKAVEHKQYGLKRKDRRDPTNDQLLFSKVFNYVSQVLNIAQPELYLKPESPGEMDMLNARDKGVLVPSFVVGANLLQGRPEKELAYVIGKKLALMRPDHFVRWPSVVPTVSELKVWFLTALKLAQPNVPIKADMEAVVNQTLGPLRAMVPPQLHEQLGVVVQQFLATKSEADLKRWSNAVDYTATRAGYLMCNDLEVAARLAQAEPVTVGNDDPKEKVRDLVQWTISDEYFNLREQLGLTIA